MRIGRIFSTPKKNEHFEAIIQQLLDQNNYGQNKHRRKVFSSSPISYTRRCQNVLDSKIEYYSCTIMFTRIIIKNNNYFCKIFGLI